MSHAIASFGDTWKEQSDSLAVSEVHHGLAEFDELRPLNHFRHHVGSHAVGPNQLALDLVLEAQLTGEVQPSLEMS